MKKFIVFLGLLFSTVICAEVLQETRPEEVRLYGMWEDISEAENQACDYYSAQNLRKDHSGEFFAFCKDDKNNSCTYLHVEFTWRYQSENKRFVQTNQKMSVIDNKFGKVTQILPEDFSRFQTKIEFLPVEKNEVQIKVTNLKTNGKAVYQYEQDNQKFDAVVAEYAAICSKMDNTESL